MHQAIDTQQQESVNPSKYEYKKIFNSPQEAVADIPDGVTVMIGGWSYSGTPRSLIMALCEQGAKDLTIILNGPGTEKFIDGNVPIASGQVKKVLCSFVQPGTAAEKAEKAGKTEIELIPQGTLVERIRAAGFGIGGFYTPTGVGTEVEMGNEKKTIDGREYILELPLKADYALIRAYQADEFGNLVYRGVMKNFNVIMAPLLVRDIGRIVGQLKDRGLSILLVEQNLPLALEVADYVYVISKGVIVHESTAEDFRSNEEVKAKYLGVAK